LIIIRGGKKLHPCRDAIKLKECLYNFMPLLSKIFICGAYKNLMTAITAHIHFPAPIVVIFTLV
jgi:hypothetical protein